MSSTGTRAEALLATALAAYRAEIMPALPPEKRYLAAMIGNALDIAARDLDDGNERAETALLDQLLPGGTVAELAAAIRSGAISDITHRELRTLLKGHIEAELAVRNPKFLSARKG